MKERYTTLSDRFRSTWTFYQFLVGVHKHHGHETPPVREDFNDVHERLQRIIPTYGVSPSPERERQLDAIERDLTRIHRDLRSVEATYAPSALRRFFDHIKRQNEKVLISLAKFYLQSDELDEDTLDKLDMLLTRASEAPSGNGSKAALRDRDSLEAIFGSVTELSPAAPPPPEELRSTVARIRRVRQELGEAEDFQGLLDSGTIDELREIKRGLGSALLHGPLLAEVIAANVDVKNRFRELYEEEEPKILADTNRIFEIERQLERNPGLASPELAEQIDLFRRSRTRFDAARRQDNLKRSDIADLRQSMSSVLQQFESLSSPSEELLEFGEDTAPVEPAGDGASIADILPPDPLLNETLHKIMFALELVAWDRPPEQASSANELHNLRLEPWEIDAYRRLMEREQPGTGVAHELQLFFLTSAALRVKMEEEAKEVRRLAESETGLSDLLERTSQSLERAREISRRFDWFIEDMLYRGETERLEETYRSRFRLLHAYSSLWLEHQSAGGIAPL